VARAAQGALQPASMTLKGRGPVMGRGRSPSMINPTIRAPTGDDAVADRAQDADREFITRIVDQAIDKRAARPTSSVKDTKDKKAALSTTVTSVRRARAKGKPSLC